MEDCLCGGKAVYHCSPCKAFICEDHKELHEKNKKNKKKTHIFEVIAFPLDSNKLEGIVENLTRKINQVKELKERLMLSTESIIQQIEELCMNALDAAEERIIYYMNLLELCQQPLQAQELKLIEEQLYTFPDFF